MSGRIDQCPFEVNMSEFFKLIIPNTREAESLIQHSRVTIHGISKHASSESAKNAFQLLLGEFFLRMTNLERTRRAIQPNLQEYLHVIQAEPVELPSIFEWTEPNAAEREIINADL